MPCEASAHALCSSEAVSPALKQEGSVGDDVPDTGSSLSWLIHPSPEHVYPGEVHSKWIRPTHSNLFQSLFFGSFLLMLALCIIWVDTSSSMKFYVPPMLVLASLAILLFRVAVYTSIGWTWYVADYCVVVNTIVMASWCRSLYSPFYIDSSTIFVAGTSVLGFTFVLKSSLLVHHIESFSSWWLHVGTIWLLYLVRQWEGVGLTSDVSMTSMLSAFSLQVYWPWATAYLAGCILRDLVTLPCGLSRQPYLCEDIVKAVTGISPPTAFLKFIYVGAHAVLSHVFAMVGCVSYKYQFVHLLWLLAATSSSIWYGVGFYEGCFQKLREKEAVGSPIARRLRAVSFEE